MLNYVHDLQYTANNIYESIIYLFILFPLLLPSHPADAADADNDDDDE